MPATMTIKLAEYQILAHWEARKKGAAKDRRQFAYSVLAVIERWEDEANQNASESRQNNL